MALLSSAGTAPGAAASFGSNAPDAGAGLAHGARIQFVDGTYVVNDHGLAKVNDPTALED